MKSINRKYKPTLIALIATLTVMFPTFANSQEGYGQVSLDNQTSYVADLYVDGAYGCRALARLICTVQIRVGTHFLEARLADGRSTSQSGVIVRQGETRTFNIHEK